MLYLVFYLFLVFIAGVLIDVAVTVYTQAVANKKVWTATTTAMLITLINFVFIVSILHGQQTENILSVLIFAAGNGIGTYFTMRKNR
jgi:uncharacterized membrane protein YvlD (DUF360 family)